MKTQEEKYKEFMKWLRDINNIHVSAMLNNHDQKELIYNKF